MHAVGQCNFARQAYPVSYYRHKAQYNRLSGQAQHCRQSSGQHAGLVQVCKALQDPLQDAMYETWASDLDDWDSQEYDNEDLIDALYTDEGSAGMTAQNVLALALALLLVAAVGNVIFKIVVVSWALFSAAVRYSAVALILICLGTLII